MLLRAVLSLPDVLEPLFAAPQRHVGKFLPALATSVVSKDLAVLVRVQKYAAVLKRM